MERLQIPELEARVKLNPDDSDAWYDLGIAYIEVEEWLKAFECFQRAEVLILDNISMELKTEGKHESAVIYHRRARQAESKTFKLSPGGSTTLRDFLVVLGIIALICFPLAFLLWSTNLFLIPLIILLIEFLIIVICLPIVLVVHYTSKRKEVNPLLQKLYYFEREMQQLENSHAMRDFDKFLRIEKLKQKQARTGQEIARIRYSESVEK